SVEALLPDPNDRQDAVVRENGSANERRVSAERADPIPMAEDRNVRSTRRVVTRQDRAAECCIDAKDRKVAPGDVLSLDTVCATLDLCLHLADKAREHAREYPIAVAKLGVQRIRHLAAVSPGVPVERSAASH